MKDQQIEKLIKAEEERQKSVINLVASENYVSADVLEALGSILTNKYAEGYSNLRYYGGNENIDKIEELCKERALKLFGLDPAEWAVNVQPLSGSPANLAVYLALMPGDGKPHSAEAPRGKIMGMELSSGGHLTHGHKVSISGKFWQQVPYDVNKETEQLDYDEIKEIALREKPDIIVAGFTAYPRIIDFKKFREIVDAVEHPERERGTLLMVDMSHIAGLVATGEHPSPFPYADVVTTTTHKTLRGPRAGLIFSRIDERELNKKIDKAVFPGIQGGPHANQIAATAVALGEAMEPEFKTYIKQVIKNAQTLATELKNKGWRIVSGGTDNHLLLIDVWNNGNPSTSSGQPIAGREASDRLEKSGIIVNKNTIPFDIRGPVDPSGLRLGTAAETTRGKKEEDMIKIAEQIDQILRK
ncbi:MAG: serine hydroxymethyltransferase [Candidatus Paceibacterota bacterium]|jgi:glycine hydroxymethyltransferase